MLKLVDREGNLLGSLIVPGGWEDTILRTGSMSFHLAARMEPFTYLRQEPIPATPFTTVCLRRNRGSHSVIAVELVEGSIHDLEGIDGVAFIPAFAQSAPAHTSSGKTYG